MADLPLLARDLVEWGLSAQPDMRVVGRTPSMATLCEVARATDPDFVVIALDDGVDLPPPCLSLLAERPHTKVLGIEVDRGRAHLYELRPDRISIGDVSPDDVAQAIRKSWAEEPALPRAGAS